MQRYTMENTHSQFGFLVKINDNQDGLLGEIAMITDALPETEEYVVQLVRDETPWIYYRSQLTLVSEVPEDLHVVSEKL